MRAALKSCETSFALPPTVTAVRTEVQRTVLNPVRLSPFSGEGAREAAGERVTIQPGEFAFWEAAQIPEQVLVLAATCTAALLVWYDPQGEVLAAAPLHVLLPHQPVQMLQELQQLSAAAGLALADATLYATGAGFAGNGTNAFSTKTAAQNWNQTLHAVLDGGLQATAAANSEQSRGGLMNRSLMLGRGEAGGLQIRQGFARERWGSLRPARPVAVPQTAANPKTLRHPRQGHAAAAHLATAEVMNISRQQRLSVRQNLRHAVGG